MNILKLLPASHNSKKPDEPKGRKQKAREAKDSITKPITMQEAYADKEEIGDISNKEECATFVQ